MAKKRIAIDPELSAPRTTAAAKTAHSTAETSDELVVTTFLSHNPVWGVCYIVHKTELVASGGHYMNCGHDESPGCYRRDGGLP
jgi:hypothetical protein